MKIIDLLNKIANGEEVPKEIKYNDDIYFYCKPCQIYELQSDKELCGEDLYHRIDNLNDEVEIIEEDKKIEKLPMIDGTANILLTTNQTRRKINEIIDYINKEN